jgi:hypothetical protein
MKLRYAHCWIAWSKMMLNYYMLKREMHLEDSLCGKISAPESLSFYLEDAPCIARLKNILYENENKKLRLFLEKHYIILRYKSKLLKNRIWK